MAGHVPGKDFELGDAGGVDATGVDGDVDGLAEVALRVAGVSALEEKFAGCEVGEKGGEFLVEVAVHVAEVVEGEGGFEVFAVPPGVADVLGVVSFAVDFVVEFCAVRA